MSYRLGVSETVPPQARLRHRGDYSGDPGSPKRRPLARGGEHPARFGQKLRSCIVSIFVAEMDSRIENGHFLGYFRRFLSGRLGLSIKV